MAKNKQIVKEETNLEVQADLQVEGYNPLEFITQTRIITGGREMINSVNVPTQTVLTQGIILFSVDRVRSNRSNACCGGWLFHDLGSGQFTLTNKGCGCDVFEIQFNTNLTAATPDALALVIQSNGEAIGGTEMDYTPAAANVYQSVSVSTLVKVPSGSSVTISIKNLSTVSALVKDANIIIKKIA